MAGFRINRTGEDVNLELTDIMRQLKDQRINSLLTVIKTELSNDMSHCKVYISSMEGIDKAKEACKGLNSAAGYIRREMNGRIKMRRTPEFHFIPDDSTEYSAGIARILNDLEREGGLGSNETEEEAWDEE